MPVQPRALSSLHRRSTRWEVAIYDGPRVVDAVAFTARHTRAALLQLASQNGAALRAMMTEAELDEEWRYDSRAGRIYFGRRAAIGFTGSTEYDRASQAAA